jgi:hypothetical protein
VGSECSKLFGYVWDCFCCCFDVLVFFGNREREERS